eukprot:s750_g2.t1
MRDGVELGGGGKPDVNEHGERLNVAVVFVSVIERPKLVLEWVLKTDQVVEVTDGQKVAQGCGQVEPAVWRVVQAERWTVVNETKDWPAGAVTGG